MENEFKLIVIVVVLFFKFSILSSYLIWIKANKWLGMLILFSVTIFLTIACIPGVGLLFITAGFLYPPFIWGLLFNFISVNIGALIANLISHRYLKDYIEYQINKSLHFKRIRQAVKMEGYRMIFLLRLGTPFSIGNYLFSAIQVKVR